MHTITTIGLDIAKSVFQVHGVDTLAAWCLGRWHGAITIPIAIRIPKQGTAYERGICVLEGDRHPTDAAHYPG
jgi:hypothetical protein